MNGAMVAVTGRRTALLAAIVLVTLFWAPPAWAHGELERSDPPNGGEVGPGRSSLTLWYSGAIVVEASSFRLSAEGGGEVPATMVVDEAESGAVVQIATEPLPRGTYSLDWKILSLDDGHPSTGSVLFGVGVRPVTVATESNGPPAPELVLRWLDLSAIMLAIGALAISWRVLGTVGEPGDDPRRRARSVALLATGLAVVTGAVTPFLHTHAPGVSATTWGEATASTLTGTSWGQVWLAREVLLILVGAALAAWAVRRDTPAAPPRAAVVALAGVVGLEAWAGHGSALPSGSWSAVVAAALHLSAAGVWAGGLVVLVLCLVPTRRSDPRSRRALVARAWRAFSPVAATAAVVLVATGLYESGRHLPELRSLTSTVYGGGVLAKAVLVSVALALAGVNTLRVNPGLMARVRRPLDQPRGWADVPPRRLTPVVAAEVLVLIAATGAAAWLTSVPTARETGTASAATRHSSNVGGVFLTFEEVPAGADRSRIIVQARSTVKPEPGPITGVEVLMAGPAGTSNVVLEPVERGRYEAETAVPVPGRWTALVTVGRAGLPDTATEVGWTVVPQGDGRAGPLEVVMTALAGLLLAVVAGAAGLVSLRHRRARPSVTGPRVAVETGSRR